MDRTKRRYRTGTNTGTNGVVSTNSMLLIEVIEIIADVHLIKIKLIKEIMVRTYSMIYLMELTQNMEQV